MKSGTCKKCPISTQRSLCCLIISAPFRLEKLVNETKGPSSFLNKHLMRTYCVPGGGGVGVGSVSCKKEDLRWTVRIWKDGEKGKGIQISGDERRWGPSQRSGWVAVSQPVTVGGRCTHSSDSEGRSGEILRDSTNRPAQHLYTVSVALETNWRILSELMSMRLKTHRNGVKDARELVSLVYVLDLAPDRHSVKSHWLAKPQINSWITEWLWEANSLKM